MIQPLFLLAAAGLFVVTQALSETTSDKDQQRMGERIRKLFIEAKELPSSQSDVRVEWIEFRNVNNLAEPFSQASDYFDAMTAATKTAKLTTGISEKDWQILYGTARDGASLITAQSKTRVTVCFGGDTTKCPASAKKLGQWEAWCQLHIEITTTAGKTTAPKINVDATSCTIGEGFTGYNGTAARAANELRKRFKALLDAELLK